jgi:hypothetical protein
MSTLCQCGSIALTSLLPATKISPIVTHILQQERSESLSRAKSVLEYVLWGPSDVSLTGPVKEREQALQRWLDLERATVLHGLVRSDRMPKPCARRPVLLAISVRAKVNELYAVNHITNSVLKMYFLDFKRCCSSGFKRVGSEE